MTLDLATLAPLAASLARAGLPVLSQILSAAAPFPFNLFVGPAFSAIAAALGEDPATTTPAAVQAKVDAAPADAMAKLQAVEAAHAASVQAAQDELAARLRDVENARDMELALVKGGSWMAWGAPAVSVLAVIGFFVVAALAMIGYGATNPSAQWVVGAAISGWTAVLSYWIGSSKGSADKTDALASIARAGAAPAAVARRR